uniref:Nuclear body protein SP140-like protein n=1 Tax=Otolemur garnettii TaxID=30611 RepID=H0XYF6_OTOGA
RMSTEDQNIVDRLIWNRIFDHFQQHKVDISYAIKKTFPFFERLHDRKLITDKLFKDSQDSCGNLVPVQKVVYNVLSELEKTFNLEVLSELFSDFHLQEYPDLIPIYESFKNVVLENSYGQEIAEEKRVEGPTGQLSLEQGNLKEKAETRNKTVRCKREREILSLLEGISLGREWMKGKYSKWSTREHQTTKHIQRERNRDRDGKRESETKKMSTKLKKRGRYRGRVKGKAPTHADHHNRPPAKKRRKRRERKHRDKNMNFQLSELPVTCGELKGTLHKEKLKQGSSVKCIQRDNGRWFSPQRFAIKGGYMRSGNWKQSIRCGGHPLKYLIQEGHICFPMPPQIY